MRLCESQLRHTPIDTRPESEKQRETRQAFVSRELLLAAYARGGALLQRLHGGEEAFNSVF